MRFLPYKALAAIDAVVASSASPPIDANQLLYVSVQIVASGAPVGVAKLQCSNDFSTDKINSTQQVVTNWSDIPSATVAVSAAGVFLVPKTDLCYRWIRVVYTKTSGTGAITANVNALGA